MLFDIWLTCSAWCLFQPSPPKGHTPFPGCPWGTVTALPSHATLADKILTIATFLQEHRYPITLMMSSSKEIHLTRSDFFTKTLFGCYGGQDSRATARCCCVSKDFFLHPPLLQGTKEIFISSPNR